MLWSLWPLRRYCRCYLVSRALAVQPFQLQHFWSVLYSWHSSKRLIKDKFGQENIPRANVAHYSFKGWRFPEWNIKSQEDLIFKLSKYYLPFEHISLYTFEDYFYISTAPNHGQSQIDHTQWWVVIDLLASLPGGDKKNKMKS